MTIAPVYNYPIATIPAPKWSPPPTGTGVMGDCPKCGKKNVYLYGRDEQRRPCCVNCIARPKPQTADRYAVPPVLYSATPYRDPGDPSERVERFLADWRKSRVSNPELWRMQDTSPVAPAILPPAAITEIEDKIYLPQYDWKANQQLGQQARALAACYESRYDWKTGEIKERVRTKA